MLRITDIKYLFHNLTGKILILYERCAVAYVNAFLLKKGILFSLRTIKIICHTGKYAV